MAFVSSGAAILGAGLLGAGGSVASALIGSNAAQKASQAQTNLGYAALNQQNQARQQLQPFISAGTNATDVLSQLTGAPGTNPNYAAFTNSPDYAFALSQGNAALQNYLNANGIAQSGGGITAAVNYNQGLATQQYGNYFNRLMQIATLGANSANAGVQGANAAAGTLGNIGQSIASGTIGSANAITGGIGAGTSAISGGINNALLYNALTRNTNPSGYASPGSFPTSGAAPIQYTGTPYQAGQ